MTERDLDIDFDFFDEPETAETAEAQRVPRRGGPPPAAPGPPRQPTSLTPLLRLVGLIAFAIFIVVVLVFWISSCEASSKHTRYSNYMAKVRAVSSQSQKLGTTLNNQITTPGIKLSDLENDLNGLAREQQQLVVQAQGIKPPGPLRIINQHMIEAMQFRYSGLTGLAEAIQREATTKKIIPGAGKRIAAQTQRFIASDVVYSDLFQTPAQKALEARGIRDVQVPGSVFVQNPDLTSSRTMIAILERIRGALTGKTTGGLHGTGLVGVKVEPGGQELSTSAETKVNVSTDLAFHVTVKDTGDSLETHIPVHLTIQQSSPIKETQTIDLIEPGQTQTLVFKDNFGARVTFGELVTVQVAVDPVQGEHNLDNNSADYKVIFSLGQ